MPFEVNRNSQISLTEQIGAGFRQAIQTSRYKDGDSLPTLRETAKSLNVSLGVVRTAIKRLSREGLVTARPSRGIRVCPSGLHRWRAHVLYPHWGGAESFYEAIITQTVTNRLLEKQILVTPVQFTGAEVAAGYPRLKSVIQTMPVDMAVLTGVADDIAVLLMGHEIPFIQMSRPAQSLRPARRMILQDIGPALAQAARHAVGCGIRSVMVVEEESAGEEARSAFKAAGLSVHVLPVKTNGTLGLPASIELGGLEGVARWLESGEPLPDLIYFGDDYQAQGGLTALLERGVRIPADVQVISWTNRNSGPVFSRPVTRIEMDPVRDGEALVELAVEALKKPDKKVKEPKVIGPTFIEGETTRRRISVMPKR